MYYFYNRIITNNYYFIKGKIHHSKNGNRVQYFKNNRFFKNVFSQSQGQGKERKQEHTMVENVKHDG